MSTTGEQPEIKLKKRVSSKPPKPIPELSDRAKREQQIRLLKQSLPRQTELAHIFATDPEEADKLASYCRQVLVKIDDLEEEHKQKLKEEEAERIGKVRQRAKERQEQKRAATVQSWLDKEFSAEDRAVELNEGRSLARSERRERFQEELKSRKSFREEQLQNKESRILGSIKAWEQNVEEIEQRKRDDRKKFEYDSHARGLAHDKVVANIRQAEKDRINTANEAANDITYELELHSWRARLARDTRAQRAHELASKTVPKSDVDRKRHEQVKAQVRAKEDRYYRNLMSVAEEKEKETEERLAKQKAQTERAQKRIEENKRKEQEKLDRLASKIRTREDHLREKDAERKHNLKKASSERHAKIKAFQDNADRQVELKNAELAQKWADRALRIGELAGIQSQHRPDLVRTHADALEASQRASSPTKNNDSSGTGKKQNSSSFDTIALVVKSSPEFPPWLGLLGPKKKLSNSTKVPEKEKKMSKSHKNKHDVKQTSNSDEKKKKKITGQTTDLKHQETAVLRMQSLRRQVMASNDIDERKALTESQRAKKDAAVREVQSSARQRQAKAEVAERRSRSSSPVKGRQRGETDSYTGGGAGGSRASREDQEEAIRLIQSAERHREAKEATGLRRAASREKKSAAAKRKAEHDSAAEDDDEIPPPPPDLVSQTSTASREDAARLIQSAEKQKVAKESVALKRSQSQERTRKGGDSSTVE